MNNHQSNSNWQQFKNNLIDQWRWLTHAQLDLIGDNQNYFTGKPHKNSYVTDIVEAEKRLSDWQKGQRDKMRNQK
ncbi:hypothetical protein [Crenothrix polyspora]|uniref:Uncharacterized protein n=1 Tax=Crenothrix polyspora TaxID=360316 RepID=A0A1R4H130_9GAMM|nr:hypothetical protein [Crenothrix polyspora]SJM89760.1 conserved hypothetical protein [Crenothrix polyspora]